MKALEWTTEQMMVNDLIPLDINPRKITDEKRMKMIESLQKFNLVDIPVIDFDNTLISGHQRCRALQAIGRGEEIIDVRKPNRMLTERERKEYNLMANTHFGEFDMDLFLENFGDINLDELGINDSFSNVMENEDFAVEGEGEDVKAEEDDYEIPEEIKTEIVLGDLIEIGRHRLLCGDSRLAETFELLMNGKMADMVITDPPYNVDYTGGTKDALKIQNDKLSDDEFYQFLLKFYTALAQYSRPGCAWYVWHSDSEGANFRAAMKNAGLMFKQCLIWVKNSLVMGRQDYQWKHEPCLYGWKPGASHLWYSDRKQTTVLEFDRPVRNAEHPTMKPVPLFGYLIRNSSRRGQIVVDAFAGSGTTVVTCHQMDRTAYVAENDPKYCQVIVDRMMKLDPSVDIRKNGVPWNTQTSS